MKVTNKTSNKNRTHLPLLNPDYKAQAECSHEYHKRFKFLQFFHAMDHSGNHENN